MKKSFIILSALVAALVVPVVTASASQISFVSVAGNWHDPVDNVPGNQQGQPVITNGVPTSSINWGVANGPQSGYDFSRQIPGTQTLPPAPTPFFPLGTFTHRNFPVSDPSLTSVQLDVVLLLNVDGVQTGPLNFTFTFNHVETPNNARPCPYPTPNGEGCTDRVTFVSAPQPTTFRVAGVDYTLSMSFVDGNGNPVAEFITREGRVNTANLVGQFTLAPVTQPVITVTKSGPSTMSAGQWGTFTIAAQNTGVGDAWNASIRDVLPDGATGGMCDLTPEILSARVFAADGVTPVPGKGPLNPGTDYSLSYSAAPTCRLNLTMLTAAGRIGPNERLIIRYRTQLDANTQNGVALTNVAGAIQWFNDNISNPNRTVANRTLTNGTPGVPDHEDAFTVTASIAGYFFEKTAANLTSGANPATTAAPGDRLRYTLRVRTTGQALTNLRIFDDLDVLNAPPAFVAGTLALGTPPPGVDVSGTSSTGGSKGTGVIDIRNLNVPANGQVAISFDITLSSTLTNNFVVTNQSSLRLADNTVFALSDDPNVNGQARSDVPGDEDPTRVRIVSAPAAASFVVQKISTDLTGNPNLLLAGETLRYAITVRNTGSGNAANVTLRDAVPANTTYVAGTTRLNGAPVADVAGVSPLVNSMPVNSPADPTPGSLPAGATATITFDVVVNQNAAVGTVISNQGFVTAAASGIIDQPSDDPDTPSANDPTRDIVGTPGGAAFLVQKISTDLTGDPNLLLAGETLRYAITVRNTGSGNAANVTLRDAVPANTTYVAGTTRLNGAAVADVAGMSPLVNSMPVNSPADPTPGSLPAGATATITFDVVVNSNVAVGTVISNQGFVTAAASGITDQPSDDPDTPSANDPTRDTVGTPAAAAFLVQKVSTDLTNDPNVLLAGETLRYTITVRNTGSGNAANVTLRDAVPANTTYVTGSSRLNGAPVADVAGQSPLISSMPINALPAGATATITFDVVVNSNVAGGTVISNQGFLTAAASGITDQPSDDPDTPAPNDPTRDIVGTPAAAAFLVQKVSADLAGDPNVLLPGEPLRYTITVRNTGSGNAANVTLRDAVPANTTYVTGSTRLNGAAVADVAAQPPLVNSMPINALPAGATATITFNVVVNSNVAPGTVISNQGFLTAAESGITDQPSDDPDTPAPNDPTRDIVGTPAAAAFLVQKVSTDLTGDPNLLLAGETLRYTITVRNTGTGPAADVTLRDVVPENTTYVASSTRLNGAPVADVFGVSPLVNGMPINSLPAGTTATITFDVVVNANVDNGTVISNQGFVSAPASGITDQPSDDPDTPAPNDPTQDTVGNQSAQFLVYKISTDQTGDPNLLLPGETLRYTITVRNTGNGPAANVTLRDAVPANTTYLASSTTLNGAPVADAGGQSALLNGMPINSLPVGTTATITFDVIVNVNANVVSGTVISNQGFVSAPAGGIVDQPSDDPDTPAPNDPTRDTVGGTATFLVQKISTDLTGDANLLLAGETLRYTITVRNTGTSDAVNVTLRDVVPANTIYVASSTTLNGAPVADAGGQSALVNGMPINSLPAGTTITITFDVVVNANVGSGTVISNQGFVSAPASGIVDQPSDDPDTPAVNDPTRDTVGGAATFLVQKISTDLTGDPNLLLAGETLRYTITVRNTGNGDAVNVTLRDVVPANTTYVASSTTLNGSPVADAGGQSALVNGMPINSLPAGTTATITFDVVVNANVVSGTVISNQGFVSVPASGIVDQPSDDPDTPAVNDPTRDTVGNQPAQFLVQKISTDLTGDPNVLLAGETLRYTITVRNTGNSDAANVTLRDAVPANTTYVASSTTLNGSPVADSGGVSALVNGMPINALPAGATATITFDVVVNRNAANATVISNQGFVSAAGGIVDQPSDDPDTPDPNDPTRDIVGSLPLVYAEMRVALSVDRGSPGIVDPGDVLRYTITARNSAEIAATSVVIRDSVPANTTYVANSTVLNGLPVGQPDGGVSPLASGIPTSSSDLTPPLPASGAGKLSAGGSSLIQFEVRVNDGTPARTVISTQAIVNSAELSDILTDGDGNPATGPEPTVVVVGESQQLSIKNEVVVVGGGAPVPGAVLEYTVRVSNISAVPVLNLVITDDLNASESGQLAHVNGSATMSGAAGGVTFAGSTITAAVSGPLNPGEVATLRFRAILASGLAPGTVVTNTALASWNDPTQTASASVSITVSGVPGLVVLSGAAWHDADFDDVKDSGERLLAGWSVNLYRDGRVLDSVLTDEGGVYRFIGVAPNDVSGSPYELRFSAPGAGASTAMLGLTASPFTNGMQRITNIVVGSGANLQDLNLPIDPNGVIYNSVARTPIAAATVTLLDARSASPLPASCFDDAAQQGQITLADGYYKFDINFSDPACPGGGDYLINVTAPPGSTYRAGYSQMIPPTSGASNRAFPVPVCPASADDAIPGTAMFCEVQRSEFPPAASIPTRSAGTNYHVHVSLDSSRIPGTSQIFNNHIPIDTLVSGTLSISKTTSAVNVTRGQLIPYLITVNNAGGLMLSDVSIVDRFPAGFSYVKGSAVLDGVPTEPSVVGRELRWNGLEFAGTQVRTLRVLFVVGAGLTGGEYVNRALLVNGGVNRALEDGAAANPGEATATVRLMPDPTFDCTEVTGKVFNDANRNGVQDDGEEGLVGVRVVTARGLQATTDQFGRYHMTCAITPNESRGSNFVLKLDDRTLPSGFRLSTDQVQIKRVTRGKAMRFNFGASIHRVVGIDLSDAVFEPGSTEIRAHWRPRVNLLLEELRKSPTVLRLSYIADTEDAALVERRVETVKRQLTEAWNAANTYVITIEPEVFWRRGAPPKKR